MYFKKCQKCKIRRFLLVFSCKLKMRYFMFFLIQPAKCTIFSRFFLFLYMPKMQKKRINILHFFIIKKRKKDILYIIHQKTQKTIYFVVFCSSHTMIYNFKNMLKKKQYTLLFTCFALVNYYHI